MAKQQLFSRKRISWNVISEWRNYTQNLQVTGCLTWATPMSILYLCDIDIGQFICLFLFILDVDQSEIDTALTIGKDANRITKQVLEGVRKMESTVSDLQGYLNTANQYESIVEDISSKSAYKLF